MPNIEYLRAKALAYAPTFKYPLCLDPDKRAVIDAAMATLTGLHDEKRQLESLPPEQKRAKAIAKTSPTKELDERIKAAEVALQDAEDAAADDVLVLVWRRMDPDAYDDLLLAHTANGRLDTVAIYPALAETCWHRAETADGEDVGLSWAEARGLLNNADRDAVHVGVMTLNRSPSDIPFSRRSSGTPGTSSDPA